MRPIPPELFLHVPGCESGAPPRSVRPLAGGRNVNSVWHVQTKAGDFVLRLRHPPVDRPGSVSRFELASHRLAAGAGLAPQILDAADDGHWLLMEFVAGPAWGETQLLAEAGIEALGSALRRLHALDCAHLPRMDAAAIGRGYLEAIAKSQPDSAAAATAEVAELERQALQIDRLPARAALNHGDLMAANVMGVRPILVDWEYAQCTHPTWDLACLLAYYPNLAPRRERLLEACGLAGAEDRHILSLQQELFARLDRLWQWVQRTGTG